MKYSDLLNQYIEQSGLTLGEIAKKVNELGVKAERSYISMLKNNKTKNPASEEVNRALATVTGGDPDRLVFAAFIDKAPESMKKILENINDLDTFLDEFMKKTKIKLDENLVKDQLKVMGLSDDEIASISIDTNDILKVMSFEEKLEFLRVFVEDAVNQKKSFNEYLSELQGINHSLKSNVVPFDSGSMLKIPLVGKIAAGTPIDRIENIEGYTLVDPYILRGKDGFALEVKGDSMTGDRIFNGDLVIVAKQEEVSSSDIAVVVVDNDLVTLKRIRREGNQCLLIPSNPTMQPSLVPAEQVKVIGKVVEVKFWPK
ncbi:MAG: S24 family peptidase [Bacillota bacterium]